MATSTSNFGLTKPAYTDTADIADINGNMDKVDVSLNGLADAIAIVAKNNTHAAITAGQYVYVHGHGTLAEGLYTADSNIAANATLSSSNLTADSAGGLNALNSNINNKFANIVKPTVETYVSWQKGGYLQLGRLVIIDIEFKVFNPFSTNDPLFTVPTPNIQDVSLTLCDSSGTPISGNCRVYSSKVRPGAALSSGNTYRISGVYFSAS